MLFFFQVRYVGGLKKISCMLPTRYVSLRNIQMIQMDPENLRGALRLKLHGDMTIFNSKLIRIIYIYVLYLIMYIYIYIGIYYIYIYVCIYIYIIISLFMLVLTMCLALLPIFSCSVSLFLFMPPEKLHKTPRSSRGPLLARGT